MTQKLPTRLPQVSGIPSWLADWMRRVIEAINSLIDSGGGPGGSGDMTKAVYDPDNDGKFSADIIVDGTTNKTYTAVEQAKLAGIAANAEVNVNADWSAVSGDAQILNKPTLITQADVQRAVTLRL